MSPAKRIARSLARSAIYHKKTGLGAAGVGLVACVLVVLIDAVLPKGAATAMAVGAAYVAFRALRHAQRYVSAEGSPVLEAISQEPTAIERVTWQHGRDGEEVVVEAKGERLALRPDPPTEEGAKELLEAFRERAPQAAVELPDA